nr:MAG TPA: hypothetical protein [Caudoviricetes sp.]
MCGPFVWLDVSSLAPLPGLRNPQSGLLSSCYVAGIGILGPIRHAGVQEYLDRSDRPSISNVLAPEAIWELSPPDPVAP